MANQKNKRVLKIADELEGLADQYHDPSLREAAVLLRKAVTSGKTTSNEQSNEDDDTGGGNPPPSKEKPDKP